MQSQGEKRFSKITFQRKAQESWVTRLMYAILYIWNISLCILFLKEVGWNFNSPVKAISSRTAKGFIRISSIILAVILFGAIIMILLELTEPNAVFHVHTIAVYLMVVCYAVLTVLAIDLSNFDKKWPRNTMMICVYLIFAITIIMVIDKEIFLRPKIFPLSSFFWLLFIFAGCAVVVTTKKGLEIFRTK
jgi:hypothetical protein